jgi:hypothetical protein
MSESFLGLRYEPEGDGTGLLKARVQTASFSGQSEAWFGEEQLLSFARALADTFPLPTHFNLQLKAGAPYTDRGTSEQHPPYVAISVYPIGTTGAIGIRVELASPIYEAERPEAQSTVGLELITRYGPLQKFASELISVVQGKSSHAKLEQYEP